VGVGWFVHQADGGSLRVGVGEYPTPGHIVNVDLSLAFGVIVGMMFGFIVGNAMARSLKLIGKALPDL
jgi:hypothetical protein